MCKLYKNAVAYRIPAAAQRINKIEAAHTCIHLFAPSANVFAMLPICSSLRLDDWNRNMWVALIVLIRWATVCILYAIRFSRLACDASQMHHVRITREVDTSICMVRQACSDLQIKPRTRAAHYQEPWSAHTQSPIENANQFQNTYDSCLSLKNDRTILFFLPQAVYFV